MIDCHCHLLPAVDDGAADWNVSLAMARMASADGVTQVIATPHWTGQPGEMDLLRGRLQELQQRLQAENIPLTLHLGNELILVPNLPRYLESQRANTLAGSSYLLLETAQFEQTGYTENALRQLQSAGYRIILAHPERLRRWQEEPEQLRQLVWRGCYLQINAGSLRGEFGRSAQKLAHMLLQMRWVSLLSSDGHSDTRRRPLLGDALRECARIIGDTAAQALVTSNPQQILDDKMLPYVEPDIPFPRQRFQLFPWLRR